MVIIKTRDCYNGSTYAKIVHQKRKPFISKAGDKIHYYEAPDLRTWIDDQLYGCPHTKSEIIVNLEAGQEVEVIRQ